jgi:hypothetical protein
MVMPVLAETKAVLLHSYYVSLCSADAVAGKVWASRAELDALCTGNALYGQQTRT